MTGEAEGNRGFSPDDSDGVDGWLSRIARSLPEFRDRPGQREMIRLVRDTFSRARTSGEPDETGRSLLVVEGPTGTGKTLAYLLPGIIMARKLGKKLVVSSVTVGLQEQLAGKDIPFLEAHSGFPLTHAIAKGRGRYVCERDLLLFADGRLVSPPGARELFQKMERALGVDWDGDRDGWPGGMDERLFSLVSNRQESCSGIHCAYYDDCLYFKNRKGIEHVDVVVTNHDLLLADAMLGGGIVLPDPANSLLVVDEAHHLPRKATEAFRSELPVDAATRILSEIPPVLAAGVSALRARELGNEVVSAQETVLSLSALLSRVAHFLEINWPSDSRTSSREEAIGGLFSGPSTISVWRFARGILPDALLADLSRVQDHFLTLKSALSHLREAIAQRLPESPGGDRSLDQGLLETGLLLRHVTGFLRLTESVTGRMSPAGGPMAVWAQRSLQGGIVSYSLHAGPMIAGGVLKELLWSRVSSAVATSATLTALGQFDYFLFQSGLSLFPGVATRRLPSPFDHERQGLVRVPSMRCEPNDPGHSREVAEWMRTGIDPGEGTLVLFSSKKQMEEVARLLSPALSGRLLMQGSLSRERLLSRHQQQIENGEGSLLFGLASLAEGLDLKGVLLTHVVIVRIPFFPPTEPLGEAFAEWIEDQGKSSFREIQLPQASLRLIQAVGRLIRSETDWGVVTILDKRMTTKSYGRDLFRALPPFPVRIGEEP